MLRHAAVVPSKLLCSALRCAVAPCAVSVLSMLLCAVRHVCNTPCCCTLCCAVPVSMLCPYCSPFCLKAMRYSRDSLGP